ncbi:DMT family transporter [Pelagovum pacificum]|nr:DMT family transporter [Pelagovum pacificum]
MVLAMMGFAVEDAFFKAASASASPGLLTVIFGVLGTVAFAVLSWRAGQSPVTPQMLKPRLLIRSAFEIVGRLFFALALAFTPLSTTSAILQATPLVVTLGAAVLLGEHVGPRRWVAILLGFCGVLLILRPTPAGFEVSALLAVMGMIGFAGRDLATRASPPEVSGNQLGVLGFLVVTAAGLVILATEGGAPTIDLPAALRICGTATAGVLAYAALTRAMRTGEISVVAPFRYSRLLIALLFAYVLFGERPDALTLAGAGLIVGSGLYTLWRSHRAGR